MLYKAGGISEPSIARILGIAQNTLRKHFEFELNCGRGVKRAQNLKRLEEAADGKNVAAMKALNVLFDKGDVADLLADEDYNAARRQRQEQSVKSRPTKSAMALEEALAAGRDSEWGDDLAPISGARPN